MGEEAGSSLLAINHLFSDINTNSTEQEEINGILKVFPPFEGLVTSVGTGVHNRRRKARASCGPRADQREKGGGANGAQGQAPLSPEGGVVAVVFE